MLFMSFYRRRHPASGVIELLGRPTIVFLTVCLHEKSKTLASESVRTELHRIWGAEAKAWLVGDYVLMPDHLHLFRSPAGFPARFSVEEWIEFWKSRASKAIGWGPGIWQTGGFHHRIRDAAQYQSKWEYMRQNP